MEDDDTYKVGKNGKIERVDGRQYLDKNGNTVDRLYATDKNGNMTQDYVEVGSDALSTKRDGSGVIKKDGKTSTFKYQSLSFGNKPLLRGLLSLTILVMAVAVAKAVTVEEL